MNISSLINPDTPSGPTSERTVLEARQFSLPPSVAKPRKHSKHFTPDRRGYIHLLPPRRTVPHTRQMFLRPRADYLFGDNAPGSRGLTVERDHHGVVRVLCNPKWAPRRRVFANYSHRPQNYNPQKGGEGPFVAPLLPMRGNTENVRRGMVGYTGMPVGPRIVRSEAEQQVQKFHATAAVRSSMHPPSFVPLSTGPALHREPGPVLYHAMFAQLERVGVPESTLRPAKWPNTPAT